MHVGTLEGFQRVRWLYLTATADSNPAGTLTVAVDFDDSYGSAPGAYSLAVSLATITFGVGRSIDLRHKLRRMKCKSVAFTFTDSSGVPPLTGIQALALDVGRKRGTNKLPAAQGVG